MAESEENMHILLLGSHMRSADVYPGPSVCPMEVMGDSEIPHGPQALDLTFPDSS